MLDADGLPSGIEALVDLSAAVATRDPDALSAALLRAKDGADVTSVDEILLQSHLFVGFPIALNAISRWREIAELPSGSSSGEADQDWEGRGARVCERVYAGSYEALRSRVAALHPDLDRWMVAGGYGRVLGRPRVDLVTRELCIVAQLGVWDAPQQLHSHLRGAVNAGATVEQVETAVRIAARYLDADSAARVRGVWKTVTDRLENSRDRPTADRR
ncbi:MAG: carboxymuconolactone decarboxylase family protein [Gemmatimonadetes bacterium]|nr:carboxymuconolactone decarboxylase family protein [Gemmatimonadota bacterium]